ncbi:MAG: phosphatidylinositol-specific phospholipase C domain-containing protein [Muribaculaceae bacterium]|nr:phosphatidylinositol-specific phospholipase C domain-containing protein [Muribaculaceae bacterium]
MRNFSLLVSIVIFSIVSMTSCLDEPGQQTNVNSTPYKFINGYQDTIREVIDIDQANWMAGLPDSRKVCKLTIPGTHDALTGEGFYAPKLDLMFGLVATTQVSTLNQQLLSGIRFFDIRPVVSTDTIHHKKILRCCHGTGEIRMTFEESLNTIQSFLKSHPTEFCIVKIQHDNGVEDQMPWIPLMKETLNNDQYRDHFAEWRPDITVGEMRGKILFINRLEYDGMVGAVCPWPDEDSDMDENVYYDQERSRVLRSCSDESITTTMWVQDYYKVSTEKRQTTKINAVLTMIDDSRALASNESDNTWVINHCSAYSVPSPGGYIDNAEHVHPRVIENLKNNPQRIVGIVAMDFSCYDCVDCIVNGGNPYISIYLLNCHPLGQSLTNMLIANNFK